MNAGWILFHVSGSYSGMVFGEVRHRSSSPPIQSLIVGQTCRGQRGYARNRRVVADERRVPQERIQQRVGQLGRVLGGEHENQSERTPLLPQILQHVVRPVRQQAQLVADEHRVFAKRQPVLAVCEHRVPEPVHEHEPESCP